MTVARTGAHFSLIRGGMRVRTMPVELLAEASQLSREQGAPGKSSMSQTRRARVRSGDRTVDSSSTAKNYSSIHRPEPYKSCTVRHETILVDLFVETAWFANSSISVGGE